MSHLENHHWYADFLKGSLSRYIATCDATKVYSFIKKSKTTFTDIDIKKVFHKLAILLSLTTHQRDKTIKYSHLDCMKISSGSLICEGNFKNHQTRSSFTTYRTKDI